MPSTTPSVSKFGEVYLCEFPFTSGTGGKVRPVLALFDLAQDAIVCRITSVPHAEPLDIAIKDWKGAGLLKPSVARLGRLVTAEKAIFIRRLGTLAPADATAIQATWNQLMRL